jgi:hypothetical protein
MPGRRPPTLLLVTACLAAAAGEAGEALRLSGGETALELNRHILTDLGIELVARRRPVGEEGEFARLVLPMTPDPSLRVRASGGSFEALEGGALRHQGGFQLLWRDGRQSLAGFELRPGPAPTLFELHTADGAVPLILDSPHPQLLAAAGELAFLNMDLRLTSAFARRLGVPRLAGAAIGSADVRLRLAAVPEADGGVCVPDVTGDVDVELTGISSLTEAYHDSQRMAMAPAVDLRNNGPGDVEWYRPIVPDGGGDPAVVGPHPFLAMSFYRLVDGVMRQIGRADVKHAFYAANSGCPCPGDQVLFAGCSDLYSAVTNYNRINLAPRHEVTASTGVWQSHGSHFDGEPVDDTRDHFGEGLAHPDPFEHRLTVAAEDLLTDGAQYFIEAWYVVAGDSDIFNSMGHRGVAPQLDVTWGLPFTDSGVSQGPALDAWVDRAAPPPGGAATVLDTGEGHVELVARTVALAGGARRYDYGLMNFDFDRRIRSFSLPLPAGVVLASVGFHDGDGDLANDWQATVTGTEIVWSTLAAEPARGALDWGTLYNFRFDANAAPVAAAATLGILETGPEMQLAPDSVAPGGLLVAVNRLEIDRTGSGGGTVNSVPAGIGCGLDCDELYAPGTMVQLSAAADPGSALIRWTEAGVSVGSAASQDTLLDADRSLVAVFELCDRQLGPQVVAGSETFEACDVLTAGSGFVVAAAGAATLRAGSGVVLGDGLSVAQDGELTVEIDPSLLP